MRTSLHSLIALVLAVLTLTACKSNSDEVEYSSKCYISSFTLGQLTRTVKTKDILGNDSTYKFSFAGSEYKMLIDQRKQTIANLDSLPTGTRKQTVVTISSTGTVFYAPSSDAAEWKAYAETDSIDFSAPQVFRVYADDGKSFRDYTVQLNVRQQSPLEYTWTQMQALPAVARQATASRLLFVDGLPVAFIRTPDNQAYCIKGTSDTTPEWNLTACTGLAAAPDICHAQYFANAFWVTCGQTLYTSSDAINWQPATLDGECPLMQLVAASESALYASVLSADGLPVMARSTDGCTWTTMDIEAGGFTGYPAAAVAYEQENGNRRVILADQLNESENSLSIWNLLEGSDEPWVLFAQKGDNDLMLPAMRFLNIVDYSESLFAMGGALIGGDSSTALQTCYVSLDSGITWWVNDGVMIPSSLQGTTAPVSANSHGEHIWIMAGDQIWRGRLNGYDENY